MSAEERHACRSVFAQPDSDAQVLVDVGVDRDDPGSGCGQVSG
jgi:hypothetical protein